MVADEPEFEPEGILAALAAHGVRYVLIGGLAGTLHGSPVATNDADICPSNDPDNLERLAAALEALDAKVRSPDRPGGLDWARDARALSRAEIWNLVTVHGYLDISFQPAGTRGYEDLRRRAVVYELDGVEVPVAALIDVVRSKEAAGRPKDGIHLPFLRKLLERLSEQGEE